MNENPKRTIYLFKKAATTFLILFNLLACEMNTTLPRNEELDLFHPHRTDFSCHIEATNVPLIDAQAEKWFLEARALENDPELLVEERDYVQIVRLTRQAAERQHWKAMLNLSSLYLEGKDPAHGRKDAIEIVEHAMHLGIPAAYDRMGTYHMNGIVPGGATRAYAFWQKAADMGNPDAMTYIGSKLKATWDNPQESFWANIPVAMKMLECAFSQGNGEAALYLHYGYAPSGKGTVDQKTRALRVLHEGAKLGCQICAANLSIEFEESVATDDVLAPFRDKARSERYQMLSEALRHNPSRRFPNLDKVLPLPPGSLPRWDGKRDTLLKAAMAVTPPPTPRTVPVVRGTGREALDTAFDLRATGETTNDKNAPFASYWRPTAPQESTEVRAYLATIAPGLYALGEAFVMLQYPQASAKHGVIPGVVWERMLTIAHNHGAVEPRAAAGLFHELQPTEPRLSCPASKSCPVTGTWQPWLSVEHPLRHAVNQTWRQAWVTSGQAFPHPQQDWLLQLEPGDLSWHLLDSAAPNMV